MWQSFLEMLGALIVRATPNTPPAQWLPFVGYAATAICGLLIAIATIRATGSRLIAAAVTVAFVAAPHQLSHSIGPLVIALALLGFVRKPASLPSWVIPTLLVVGLMMDRSSSLILWMLVGSGLAIVADHIAASRGPQGPRLRAAAI